VRDASASADAPPAPKAAGSRPDKGREAAEAAAERIVAAAARRRRMLFIGRTARQAWWLSRVAPGLYERIMSRRLRGEMREP
jgi:hypothetical protein